MDMVTLKLYAKVWITTSVSDMMEETDKKKIVWITPDYFFDVDWPIVGRLMEKYDIRWYVIWGKGSLRAFPDDKNIFKLIVSPYRYRDLRVIKLYFSLFKEIKKFEPSIIYNGFSGIPFFYPILFRMFDRHRIIHEGHEIDPYASVVHDKLTVSYVQYYLKRVGHTQVFSKHAEQKFHKLYPGQKCTYVPMVPKDFGPATKTIDHGDRTVFLFFGGVRKSKRFDVLLEAFLALDKEHSKKAELWVYGKCDGEDRVIFDQMISGHDNIKTMFEFVPDEMVPDLFGSSSYLVQPYQQIMQSGPMMIAYNYNLPVIATNIDGFKERIDDGKNGYLFETNNPADLKRVLEICIDQSKDEYYNIKENLKYFVEQEYSSNVVIKKYCDMLDYFISSCNR